MIAGACLGAVLILKVDLLAPLAAAAGTAIVLAVVDSRRSTPDAIKAG